MCGWSISYKGKKKVEIFSEEASAKIIVESKLVTAPQKLTVSQTCNLNFLVAIFLRDKSNFNNSF